MQAAAFAGLERRAGGRELSRAEGKKEEQQPGANVTRKAAADGMCGRRGGVADGPADGGKLRPGSSSEGTPAATGASCCNLPPGTPRERSNNDDEQAIELCWLPPVPARETGARSARRQGVLLPRPLLVRARWLCSSIGVGIRAPTSGRPRNGRGGCRAARPATRQCPRLVARRRPSAAAAARAAEHGAAGPQRPAAPQPCTSRAWSRLRSTRARAASVGRRERAAAEDGGRGWEAARRQPVPQSTGVGGMRAPRSPSRQQASFFFSLAPWRLLFALETLTSSPAARQRRSGRRPPAQQLGVGACASDQRSCRLPTRKRRPGSAGRETRSLATAATRPPSSVASCAPALRESRETQADPTTSKRRWRHARDRPRLLAPRPRRSTTTGGRRDDPRARRARTRTPLLSGQRDACRGHTARAVAPGPSKQHHRPGAPKY